ncbi:MAG TPA: aminomethyl-transferring glycine dehydrogenase subunit GcvPB [Spirochaetota bacterium]|nr:aminomethyl-transferring glycine dehydrogenase subunit GcvPB [Spirochaetota bacterium]
MKTIFETGKKGKRGFGIPQWDIPDSDPIPDTYLSGAIDLIDVSEVDVVRHYTNLSRANFGVDSGMYPLGSCTMKYNPKVNEKYSSLKGFADLHPLVDESSCQGALEVLYDLASYLSAITGMKRFSMMPAAGAHGELASVMIIKKYFEDLGEERKIILTPDSAHGTNPASVATCGFEVKEVPSTAEGDVDIEALRSMIDGNVAAMMLTSPNTLGLFDRNVHLIADMLHENGSLFYCDGANLNAVMGKAMVADMGFDVMHINLHKTFSTPHGGGGPGAGPIGVVDRLEKYLPVPVVEKREDGSYYLDSDRPDSIGRIHAFYGNFLVCLKAYIYIRMLGAEGIRAVSENAVLNANYLLARLKESYTLPIARRCMHEFVLSDTGVPNGVTTNDIAKRILDYGFHAPTVYFPLLIHGAIMIEPTETELRDTLDSFVEAMKAIREEAQNDPDMVKAAPHTTAVRRVDAVTAARKPVLKWEP